MLRCSMTLRFLFIFLLPYCWAKCPSDTLCDQTFNRCYTYVDRGRSYFAAEEDCISLGGHLASVENMFENAVIGETADSMFNGYNAFWVGANYIIENKWSWTDETIWNFVNWFPGEPSNQTAVSVFISGHQWTTSNPDHAKPYVCELPYSFHLATDTIPIQPSTACPACGTCSDKPLCDSGWTYFAGTKSCYKVGFNEAFHEAENYCATLGGHLTSIHSEEENAFVSEIASMGRATEDADSTWIGLYLNTGDWKWTDGTENTYTSWGLFTPQGLSGSCATLFPMGWTGGPGFVQKWLPDLCGLEHRNFVCKKPAL